MYSTPHHVQREAFCLGCGKTGTTQVPSNPYRAPVEGAHPGWCFSEACQEARITFRKVTDRILNREA